MKVIDITGAREILEKYNDEPFHLRHAEVVSGVVLADQVRCVDWKVRRAEFAGRAPESVVAETQAKLAPLLGL